MHTDKTTAMHSTGQGVIRPCQTRLVWRARVCGPGAAGRSRAVVWLMCAFALLLGGLTPGAQAADPREMVVMLTAQNAGGRSINGSGVIVGADATHLFIATAYHNVFDKEAFPPEQFLDIRVRFSHRGGHEYPAEYLGIADVNNDLAPLKVRRDAGLRMPRFDIASRALGAAEYRGSAVVGVGYPNWEMPTSGDYVRDSNDKNQIIVRSVAIREGFSGGGLFDANGSDFIGMIIETKGNEATVVPAQFIGDWFRQNRLPLSVSGLMRQAAASTAAQQPDKWSAGELADVGLDVSRIAAASGNSIRYEVLAVSGSAMSHIRRGDTIEKVNYKSIPPTFNWERDVSGSLVKEKSAVTLAVRRNSTVFVTRCEKRSGKVFCK